MIRRLGAHFRNLHIRFLPMLAEVHDTLCRAGSATLILAVTALSLSSCSRQEAGFRSGQWVGYAAISNERLLPIRTVLSLDPDSIAGHFLVAGERTEIPEISVWSDSIRFEFSEYGAAMLARLGVDRISGKYLRFRDDTTGFPFVLFPDESIDRGEPADPSIAGTYRVVLGTGDTADDSSIAKLDVRDGRLSGTVVHPSGDYGLLEGYSENGSIRLYRFTGWQALHFELVESEIGYRGQVRVRAEPPTEVAFLHTTDDAREIPRITRMKSPREPFLFSGLTENGEILTSEDDRFAGKPLIIDIMGTWCHNCLDAAPLLQRAFEQHADSGLHVVSLAFEIQDDVVAGLKNLALFRDRFGLTYPLLYCGSLGEANIEARLRSQLDDFFSYPTTIFVGRDGRVVDIHTGFNGPGSGTLWDEQIAEFEAAVERIVGP